MTDAGSFDPLALAGDLMSGRAGPAWAERSRRTRALFAHYFGAEGPPSTLESIPEESRSGGSQTSARPSAPHRAIAARVLSAYWDALFSQDFEEVYAALHEEVCVLWGDGTLGYHPRRDLARLLEQRAAEPPASLLEDLRFYTYPELRGLLARGLPEALDALLGAADGLIVTARLDVLAPRRLTFVVSPEVFRGEWRVRNFPLPGIDEAHLAGARASADEDEAIRLADRIVRHWLLGHSTQLASLRNHLMPYLWLGGQELVDAETFAEMTRSPPHRADRSELVFLGPVPGTLEELEGAAGKERMAPIQRDAKKVWHERWDRLQPKVVWTGIGTLDPESGAVQEAGGAACVFLRCVERDQRGIDLECWRLGALFV